MTQSTTSNHEPIFWTSTQPNYSDKDRVKESMIDGKRVRERIPQRGHVGEYDNYTMAPGVRFIRVIRHDGHIVDSVLTNGAAHMDPHSAYGQYIQAQHRHFGWFGAGECPCALVASGRFSRECLVHPANRDAQPCEPGSYSGQKPCPHTVAELRARREQHNGLMAEKEASSKSKDDKLIELLTEHVVGKSEPKAEAKPEPRGGKRE